MYQTPSQFITAARTLKQALLTCLITSQSLRIETGSAGCVPCVVDKPNRIILNNGYAIQMVPADAPEPAERFLARPVLGRSIPVVTNYDALTSQEQHHGGPSVMLDIRSDSEKALSWSARDRAGLSVAVHLPPDAVVELLNFVMESPEFSDESIFALKSCAGTAHRTGARFKDKILTLVKATQPATDECQSRMKAGLHSAFGLGAPLVAADSLYAACCGDAAVRGKTEFDEKDVLRLVQPVLAHRVYFDGEPVHGYQSQLTRVAEWALAS